MDIYALGWLILRIVFAWMFLYPIITLLKTWHDTVKTTALLFPWQPAFFTICSILIMFFGALSILVGFFAQVGAIGLCAISLGGAIIHYRLAAQAEKLSQQLPLSSAKEQLITLAQVGNVTSAQKNFVLAAVAIFFILVGSGPVSISNINIFT